MAEKTYRAWDDGAEFIASLQANKGQLETFLNSHSPEDRRQMADGLAEYLTQAVARDPNALPMGLSESLDAARSGKVKGGTVLNALKGIKNDFYNLFDTHPNVMLTTGGVVGLGGGLSLLKHYGMDKGTTGGMLTSIGNMVFQSEKLVTLSTGPFNKNKDKPEVDTSLAGQLAAAIDGKMPEGATLPEGMDPDSPEGKMVMESGKAMSGFFDNMVRHREMLIGNILVMGETFQTGGFMSDAFFDKKHAAEISPERHKAEQRTAKGGMINAASNTLLMGLTYYNQYIDPKLQSLDKNSPTYAQDRAKVWDDAPTSHIFKPGRICARAIGAMPEKLRGLIPNAAIGASFLPLAGMMMEGAKGGKDGGLAPFQFYGSLAIMGNVLLNYTAITNRSKGQQVLSPEEIGSFAGVVAEAASQQLASGTAPDAEELEGLKQVILGQSFVAPEHEGKVEQALSAAFGQDFVAVRDHSRSLPVSNEPVLLSASHGVTQAVKALGADEADLSANQATLLFDSAPEATKHAVDAINTLARQGSHVARMLGGIEFQPAVDGRVQVQLQARALPMLVNAARVLAAEPDVLSQGEAAIAAKVQQAMQTTPPLLHLAPRQEAAQGLQR